jgi:cell division protein FtsN
MAEVEPEVVETVETIEATVEPTVEPEPEPEPEKKKRKKRDDAPVRAPRVRRVAPKPSVVREELPPAPAPTEVDANFFVQLGHNLRALEKESRQRRLSALEIV